MQLNSWQVDAHSPLAADDVETISIVVVVVAVSSASVVEVVGPMIVLVVVGGAVVVGVTVVVTAVVVVVVGSSAIVVVVVGSSVVVVVVVDDSPLPTQLHIIVVMELAERVLVNIELNLSTPPEVIRQPATWLKSNIVTSFELTSVKGQMHKWALGRAVYLSSFGHCGCLAC